MTNEKSNSGRRDSFQHHSAQSDRVQTSSWSSGFHTICSPGSGSRCHTSLSVTPPGAPKSRASGQPMVAHLARVYLMRVTAHHSSIGAGFSNEPLQALATLHTLTDYSPGWPPTLEERAARRRCGRPHQLLPLRPHGDLPGILFTIVLCFVSCSPGRHSSKAWCAHK